MYYTVTIGWETDTLDKQGNLKVKKMKYLVEDETIEGVSDTMSKYIAESGGRQGEVLSIVKTPFEEVLVKQPV